MASLQRSLLCVIVLACALGTGRLPTRADTKMDEAAVIAGLPDTETVTALNALPVDITHLTDAVLVVPKPYLPTPATDPAQGVVFGKVTYLYAGNADSLRLFCRVHYTDTADAPLAARMARLLHLFAVTLQTKTGWQAEGADTPVDVWLCRNGRAGGEQFGRSIYFDDLDAPRSSIEWIREVAHEFSHLALPAIGGYKAPEYWASGYMGERLLVRWLQRDPHGAADVEAAWGDFSGASNFSRLLIAPALALYEKVGPSASYLARTDDVGMRYLIGQTLTVDDKYGPRALGEAFAALPRARPATSADLAAAFGQVAAMQRLGSPPQPHNSGATFPVGGNAEAARRKYSLSLPPIIGAGGVLPARGNGPEGP